LELTVVYIWKKCQPLAVRVGFAELKTSKFIISELSSSEEAVLTFSRLKAVRLV
jgi:hypothetical protein